MLLLQPKLTFASGFALLIGAGNLGFGTVVFLLVLVVGRHPLDSSLARWHHHPTVRSPTFLLLGGGNGCGGRGHGCYSAVGIAGAVTVVGSGVVVVVAVVRRGWNQSRLHLAVLDGPSFLRVRR